ncbi:hypothetical protein [Mobilicoccus sp.]|uniref:TetR/AcrR family transcriptional regulator n=1 Tax=Mobilicoccus sp. TaxID=2034349 RepID=UPI0028AC9E7A|nr:hypothetical protein [Mobilicoccus sp.]
MSSAREGTGPTTAPASRRALALAAAVDVFGRDGLHGLTHGRVDAAGSLPRGTTSNHFRTRAALVQAVCEEVTDRRLAEGAGPHDDRLALAWCEVLIASRREPWIADAVAPLRARMRALVEAGRDDDIPLTTPQLMALLTGIEFAELVTGESLGVVVTMLHEARVGTRGDSSRRARSGGDGEQR